MAGFDRKSGWKWITSQGASASALIFTGEGGSFTLKSPDRNKVVFSYMFFGAGKAAGPSVSVGISTEDMPSEGDVYLSDNFAGKDLSPNDFEGICVVDQLSVAAIKGKSISAMLLGISARQLPLELLSQAPVGRFLSWLADNPTVVGQFLGTGGVDIGIKFDGVKRIFTTQADALLVMKGTSVGAQLSVGVSQNIGYVSLGKITPPIIFEDSWGVDVEPNIDPKDMTITIPSDKMFDPGRSDVRPEALSLLGKVAKYIQSGSLVRMIIEAHTDRVGTQSDNPSNPNNNKRVSEKRAGAVAQWFIQTMIVKAGMITAIGFGDTDPVKPNVIKKTPVVGFGEIPDEPVKPTIYDSPQGRSANRRIRILLSFKERIDWNRLDSF